MEVVQSSQYKEKVSSPILNQVAERTASISTGFTIPLLPRGRVDNVLFRSQVGLRDSEISEQDLFALLAAPEAHAGIVFPSHFFEFANKTKCLEQLEKMGQPFFVQVSPGAELRDYLPELQALAHRSPALRASVELVFDRSPHTGDWEIIRALEGLGLSFRYIYCPIKEINALDTVRALPREVYNNLYFYFAAKLHRYDSQISPDEIVLLISSLRESVPELPLRVVNHLRRVEPKQTAGIARVALDLSSLERDFRQDPQFDLYLKNYPKMGQGGWARDLALTLNRRSFTAPFVSLFYWFLMLLRNPPEASVVFLVATRNLFLFIGYFLRHQIRQFFVFSRNSLLKAYFIFRGIKYKADVFGYRGWHFAYFSVRNSLAQLSFWIFNRTEIAFFFLRKIVLEISFRLRHAIVLAFYFLHHGFYILFFGYAYIRHFVIIVYFALRNPMWAMEQRTPRAYRFIGYPLVKFFWFSKYQIEKRIFGLHRSGA